MRAILTNHTLDNQHEKHLQWIMQDKAKRITNYYLQENQRHFVVQNIEPSFTFTSEYAYDNKAERPAIYFIPSVIDNLKRNFTIFNKRTTKIANFDDFFVKFNIFMEKELKQMKLFIKNGKTLNLFYDFLQTARANSFLDENCIMFFSENFADEIYYTIQGGFEKTYYFATIIDKLFFTNGTDLFINKFALINNSINLKFEIKPQLLGKIDDFISKFEKGKK